MKIGIVGAGKLGLPVALAIESKGHEVHAFDLDDRVEKYLEERQIPYKEEGIQPYLDNHRIQWEIDIADVVEKCEITFLAIQTPHGPEYEGTTLLPEHRADFDYTYLVDAVNQASAACEKIGQNRTIAAISTCLPGTFKREIEPILSGRVDYVYTPQFIAMGTVIHDFLNPEFNLIGVHSKTPAKQVEDFYSTINDAPAVQTDIGTAEGIKVSYNTWITAKTVIANAWGEMCDRMGMDFADMKIAWDLAGNRLLSNKYMEAGMSDGGGCHPRDNIALSWLSDQIGMSHNIWEDLMTARQEHERWLAHYAAEYAKQHELPLIILGRSFKPETNIETGSPAILLANILKAMGVSITHVEDLAPEQFIPAVYFIATQHERYTNYLYPRGSIVLDPFGFVPKRPGIDVKWIGREADTTPSPRRV